MSRRLCAVLLSALVIGACSGKQNLSKPTDALVTPSGLASKVLQVGLGSTHPKTTSLVTVHYTGWLPDGTEFDTTRNGQPATFPVDQVIPGWTEALQLMVKGEKRRFWIPGKLGYDNIPSRPGVPKGDLIFDIELIEIR